MKNKLTKIINEEPNTIRAFVAKEVLEYSNPKMFFSDLFHHGCISGMIGSLTYYADTHEFFDKYYDEIESIRED